MHPYTPNRFAKIYILQTSGSSSESRGRSQLRKITFCNSPIALWDSVKWLYTTTAALGATEVKNDSKNTLSLKGYHLETKA